jgi:hypothetical protein
MTPCKAWAVVDEQGRVRRLCMTRADADFWREGQMRVVRVEVRAVQP